VSVIAANRVALLVCVIVLGASTVSAQAPSANAPQAPAFTETVEVVGATPLHGLGIDRNKVPANIQTATSQELRRTGGSSLAEQVHIGVPSVHANDATANPFQQDLQFRGFVGSPLLGLPQGLAIYQNGVRLNEPFGDTVHWDLLPENAVASLNVVPGSNPLFGLNALGGAMSIQTKTGFSHAGHAASATGGSFGRRRVDAESGGNRGRLGYFVAGTALNEEGWRDFSPSRLRQAFGDVEWRGDATTVNGTITAAANRLIGNGPAPVQLLDDDRTAIFTHPDETETAMTLLSLRARRVARPSVVLEGTFFYRHVSIDTFNGDDSDYDECESPAFAEFLCADEGAGEPVESQFEELIPVNEDDEFDGTNNTSRTTTNGFGGTLQATVTAPVNGRPNYFVAGLDINAGRSRYAADTEIARLTANRGTVGAGLFDEEAVVRLRTTVRHLGAYAANFWTVLPNVTVMGAARFTHSSIRLIDQIGTALNGDHGFSRVNPAVGLTYQFPRAATAYGSFSMSSRVPAPSELSCADPEDPCRLPNAFVADPPLAQVIARTWEGGIRGRRDDVSWNASLFRTATGDDIMFISSGPLTNTGHFQNVGDTVRQGAEFAATGVVHAARWGVAYSFVRALFDSPLTLSSPNHPDAVDGEIAVAEGSRIPGVPQHNVKASFSTDIRQLTVGVNLIANSSQYLRGDEANLLPALDGFSVVNLVADYQISRRISVTGRVANVFDSDHSTFGLLGEADEVLGDDFDDPRFVGPGAPRSAWIGLRVAFR
jgi:outer membrane receptor protein involved in Fe transport